MEDRNVMAAFGPCTQGEASGLGSCSTGAGQRAGAGGLGC